MSYLFRTGLLVTFVSSLLACSSQPSTPSGSPGNEDAVDDIGAADTTPADLGTFESDADADVDAPPDDAAGVDADADARDTSGDSDAGSPCRTDADCPDGLCTFFDASSDSGFCTTDCASAADCPDGWTCVTFSSTGADAVQRCVAPDLCLDADEDGYGDGPGCDGRDCDDTRPDINPAADERCNGIDDDCDGRIDDNPIDERRTCETGFVGRCGAGQTLCTGGLLDCVATAPASAEQCDGIDNNCDGQSDEEGVCEGEPCCYNDRCEGVCATARRNASGSCEVPANYRADEICDTLDNDCDGLVDEGVLLTFWTDADNDTYGDAASPVQACALTPGVVANDDDCNDDNRDINPAAAEICDDIDNDCDNDTDTGVCAGLPCCWGGNCEGVCASALTGADGQCVQPTTFGDDICDGLDNNCDGATDENNPGGGLACDTGLAGLCAAGLTRCDAGDVVCDQTVLPATEVCDGLDNNCDSVVDENNPDGGAPCDTGLLGVCAAGVETCEGGDIVCAQSLAATTETCDGLDNDCDGTADNGVLLTFYVDVDDDGFGDPDAPVLACAASDTTVANDDDCNDGANAINPDAEEVCDEVDNDCDGDTDSGVCGGLPCCWNDICEGVCANALTNPDGECTAPASFGAEVCDGRDNNCDGSVDEGEPGSGASCTTGLVGVCGTGATACEGGRLVCEQTVFATPEVCDGLDNNCDGRQDEGNPGAGGTCNTGALGACATGVSICSGGSLTCLQTTNPTAETCDGVDNDCDGTVDEGNPAGGNACVTGLLGVCAAGVTACEGGSVRCVGTTAASAEVCDGFDNNCNGQVDESNPGGGGSCDTGGLGVCAQGRLQCTGAGLACQPTGFASAEVCDGLDNDCDGQIDESNPGGGGACSTGLQGVCAQGVLACSAGTLVCQGQATPGTEVCDGLDNNCNGSIDEGNPGGGGSCNTGLLGVCGPGTLTCTSGSVVCRQNVLSSAEICDNVDNNCNGTADDGNPGGGVACNTGLGGSCSAGTTACTAGAIVCNRAPNSTPESCNGIDDNCDGLVDNGASCTNCIQRNNGSKSYLFCAQHPGYWTDAQTSCTSRGYRLVTISDAAENDWLRTTINASYTNICNNTCNYARDFECDDGGPGYDWRYCAYGTDCADCGTRGPAPPAVWIGMNDRTTEGSWRWESGLAVTFTNWAAGEPNDSGGEDCGEFYTASGTWNDTECSERNRPFVCESN